MIKRGEHGASAFASEGRQFHLPAYCVDDVADPTGAGDTFAGALTGYMAARKATDFESFKKLWSPERCGPVSLSRAFRPTDCYS